MKIPLSFLLAGDETTTQQSGERQLRSCYRNMAIAEKDNVPKK
jgi:hypothetical protein